MRKLGIIETPRNTVDLELDYKSSKPSLESVRMIKLDHKVLISASPLIKHAVDEHGLPVPLPSMLGLVHSS
jgi:hypothetical protein